MIYCPDKYLREVKDVNAELSQLKGFLNDKEAKISLAKFLRANIGFTTELIKECKPSSMQMRLVNCHTIDLSKIVLMTNEAWSH
jgi:hypothetical protein